MTVSRIYNLIINIMIQLGLGQIYVFREREYINNFFCHFYKVLTQLIENEKFPMTGFERKIMTLL